MDKEEARFVLRCFRPDGADASSEDFAEALRLAASDRELGDWLAKERAKDADFSSLLGQVELPDGLREEILAGLAAERGDFPVRDEMDGRMTEALATLAPPARLRVEILAAMRRSEPEVAPTSLRRVWSIGIPLAAAAGIALAFVMSGEDRLSDPTVDGIARAIPVSHVQEAALAALSSQDFTLDLKAPDHEELFRHIRNQGRACPAGCLPPGLRDVPGLGCRIIEVENKPGAIICFLVGEGNVVHLVVFRSSDIVSEASLGATPKAEQIGDWSVARWEEKGRVFLLLGKSEKDRLNELF